MARWPDSHLQITLAQRIALEGEIIKWEPDDRRVNMVLDNVFMDAGNQFQWPAEYKRPAFGINDSIYKFVVKVKAYLCIYSTTWEQTYWIRWDKLKQFCQTYHNEWRVGTKGKPIHNISVSCFTNTRGN